MAGNTKTNSAKLSSDDIFGVVWRACDTFRGTMDPSQYKDYILVMLFLKYVSDLWRDKRDEYAKRYSGDAERVKRAMARERFVVPPEAEFGYLYERRDAANVGELIDIGLEAIEEANKLKLENVFRNIDFNSEAALGQTKERNYRLKHLLDDLKELDLRPSHLAAQDVIGDVYEFLIGKFASDSGKKGGEFYTPAGVSQLLAELLNPKPGSRICDPACGSGSLLIRVAKKVLDQNVALFGQERNGQTWALCRMNLFLHEMDAARIEWGDTLLNPKLVEKDKLMRFDVVVANPPFSLDKWGAEKADADPHKRFARGTPPKSKADFAFILHMIETAVEADGKVGVIVPHGVLFRGGAEGKIRQRLIEENLLDAVVGLPANLFYGTGIPAAILIFNRSKKTTDVLFIDASREYEDAKNQSKLRPQDIEKIVATYNKFESVEKYSYRATFEEIKENDFNLNIPRYVDTFEEEEEIDIQAAQKEIERLEAELAEVRAEMKRYLQELGL